ncbi:MAG: MerR family transcriptional regulator [Reyranellaceae bacterium]
MAGRSYTIGQVSRLSGISVRRLRFYADEGLLPPAGRTEGGYRVFSDEDLVRIGVIRALRDAGIGLEAIRSVLAEKSSIRDVLELRLREIDLQIAAQRRLASALRLALRSPEPTNDDLRRVWTMANLSTVEHRAVLERFFDKVADDPRIPAKWKGWMLEMSELDLPEEPTGEQVDAWVELQRLMTDEAFVESLRENAKDTNMRGLDMKIWQGVQDSLLAKAKEAVARGESPTSPSGMAVGEEFLTGWARATATEPDAEYLEQMRRRYLIHKPRMRRYWDLIEALGGLKNLRQRRQEGWDNKAEWDWIGQCYRARLAKN